jgi:translation initiation factor IF-3
LKKEFNKNDSVRVNGQIRITPVVLIDQDGSNHGPVPLQMAMGIASEAGLDLVEVSSSSRPPVCRVMDYGKFKFENELKDRKLKKKQSKISKMKEVRLSPAIQPHDIETKLKSAIKFLQSGQKVNVRLEFRRRQIVHKDIGNQIIRSFLDSLSEYGSAATNPKLDGKVISCVVEPKSGLGNNVKNIQQGG